MNKVKSIIKKIIKEELDQISGGKADQISLEDIAKHHEVSMVAIVREMVMGIDVESEHTDDPDLAYEIAKDHLVEFPDYYTRLTKMEKDAEK